MNRVGQALIDVISSNHSIPIRKSDRQRKRNIYDNSKNILTTYYEDAKIARVASGAKVANDEEISLYVMRQLVSYTEITNPMSSQEFEQYISDCLKAINALYNELD